MKFYSERLKEFYDTEKECVEAERLAKKKADEEAKQKEKLAEERKARAKEIDEAREVMKAAEKHYNDLVRAFVKDYNSYHYSVSTNSSNPEDLDDFIDSIFRLF